MVSAVRSARSPLPELGKSQAVAKVVLRLLGSTFAGIAPCFTQAPANRDLANALRMRFNRPAMGSMAAEDDNSRNALWRALGCRSLGLVLAAVDNAGPTGGRVGWWSNVKRAVERGG